MKTVLTKHQKKTFRADFMEHGKPHAIIATVRYDDECGNGHNSFGVTAEIYGPDYQRGEPTTKSKDGKTLYMFACGCCHDEIAAHLPQLRELIKWHLCSADEPLHYLANTLYWLGYCGWCDGKPGSPPNIEYARSAAVWPDMPESFLSPVTTAKGENVAFEQREKVKAALVERKAALLADFQKAVESLGFTF